MGETMATPPLFDEHKVVLQRNLRLLRQLTGDVPPEAAITPIIDGGSHLNWLVGHLAVARDGMLENLGQARVADEAIHVPFAQGSTPATTGLPQISELLEIMTAQQERLVASLETIAEAPDSMTDSTDLGRFAFLVWHETFHLGQAMMYRRAAGLDNPLG